MTLRSFDTETHLITPGNLAPHMVCSTFAGFGKDFDILHRFDEEKIAERLSRMFETDIVVGANTPFDVGVILRWAEQGSPLWRLVFAAYADDRVLDVQTIDKLIDIANGSLGWARSENGSVKRSYSLAELTQKYTGRDRSHVKSDPSGWRLRYSELADIPLSEWPDAAITYACDDATDTLDVLNAQLATMDVWGPNAAAQARYDLSLHLLSVHGIHTDGEAIDRLEKIVGDEVAGLTTFLVEEKLVRPNGSKDTKVAKARILAAYQRRGEAPPLTETGLLLVQNAHPPIAAGDPCLDAYVSLDADACDRCGDAVLEAYAERTSLAKILNTDIPKLRNGVEFRPDGSFGTPIQARWDLADTGRVRCSEGKPKKGQEPSSHGYQLTNPPRAVEVAGKKVPGIRECFAARGWRDAEHWLNAKFGSFDGANPDTRSPGTVLADVDFPGLELATMAQVCMSLFGFSRLGDLIRQGYDAHLALAADLLGITYDEAMARKSVDDPEILEWRQMCKAANFGLPGGLGFKRFVEYARKQFGVIITEAQARAIKPRWLAKFPEFAMYHEHFSTLTKNGPITITHLFSGRLRGRCGFTDACNCMFQGLGADAAKSALWEVTRRCYDPSMESILFGGRPVNFVHDQILCEFPIETASEQAIEMGRVMLEACNRFLPDVPIPDIEPALSFHWSKDTKAVFIDGRLVPYDWAQKNRINVVRRNGSPVVWKG